MQIKKGELNNLIKNIQQKSIDSTMRRKPSEINENLDIKPGTGSKLDGLRSHVLSIQADVKNIQTEMTVNQAKISFLQNLDNSQDWKGKLSEFMQRHFTGIDKSAEKAISEPLPTEYQQKMHDVNATLRNQLIKKEVQLQNILSSGLVDNSVFDNEISKDLLQSADLFSKLKTENIQNLLKS